MISSQNDRVILLHGLSRTPRAMVPLERFLQRHGYHVVNQGYPSRKYDIETLARMSIPKALSQCNLGSSSKVHFVTHSMGGILVRYFFDRKTLPQLGKVVMLSPPNHGSQVVDRLRNFKPFQWLNGPAGNQLGTGPASIPNQLGPPAYPVGIITGDRTINPILSLMIPGKDDGKVSVKSARLENMTDFLVLHSTHPFIMKNKTAMQQVLYFLKNGRFDKANS